MLVKILEGQYQYAGKLDMAAGHAVVLLGTESPYPSIWAAHYAPGTGWVQSSIAELTPEFTANVGPAVTVDRRGNALVAWGDGVTIRRYIAGRTWSTMTAAELDFFPMAGAAAPDGTVTLVGSKHVGSQKYVTSTARFE
jgi:hypothetical protein